MRQINRPIELVDFIINAPVVVQLYDASFVVQRANPLQLPKGFVTFEGCGDHVSLVVTSDVDVEGSMRCQVAFILRHLGPFRVLGETKTAILIQSPLEVLVSKL